MSKVYIEDMKMPKGCCDCPFYEIGTRKNDFYSRCVLNNAYFVIDYNSKNRGEYCPLVEVEND